MPTCTVACKIPNGLILELYEMVEGTESAPAGSRKVKKAVPTGPRVHIRGPALPVGVRLPKNAPAIAGGYALTPGVDADFFAKWMEQHKDADVVKNNLIFAHEQPAHAQAKAEEQEAVESGMEPIDPENLKKRGFGSIQTAERVKPS